MKLYYQGEEIFLGKTCYGIDLLDTVVDHLSIYSLLALWNWWADTLDDPTTERIYCMNDLEGYLSLKGHTAYQVLNGEVVDTDKFSVADPYFKVGIDGLLVSGYFTDLVDLFCERAFREYLMINIMCFGRFFEDDNADPEEETNS